MNLSLAGVYPPMLTPFREDGKLDIDSHLYNMSRWNEAPLNGYLVLGSNSETAYLTENEKNTINTSPSKVVLIAVAHLEIKMLETKLKYSFQKWKDTKDDKYLEIYKEYYEQLKIANKNQLKLGV